MTANDDEAGRLSGTSSPVQIHLGILQAVIERMAANSAACKTWCITLVSAILVILADKEKPELMYITLLPVLLFLILDAYYLGLEKSFRASYEVFIKKLHANDAITEDLFSITSEGNPSKHQLDAIKSFSVYGFYLALLALIITTTKLVM